MGSEMEEGWEFQICMTEHAKLMSKEHRNIAGVHAGEDI